ncbi:DNA-binding transcriptional regulator, ArsR family [Micromonospora avicenniae]|uniref:DNA-binding transcriptional regulator, ArsR family n=1 Tax=Micromonospora avicenniae TaxID=1198245 RepID=A0A1N7E3N0_9ACTN|nr:DNA-binding transcriptional regulator, ArsR family [Micromonospora avicenniae]
MHAFDVLGDPVRRRILELLSEGETSAGDVCVVIQREFGISQPAVSQHLKVLRLNGFATVRPDGTRRLYAVDPRPLRDVDKWLDHFRRFWTPPLNALATELARGKRERRLREQSATTPDGPPPPASAHHGHAESAARADERPRGRPSADPDERPRRSASTDADERPRRRATEVPDKRRAR